MDTSEIKKKLKCSLELAHIRSEMIIYTLIAGTYIALFTLAWGGWVLALVISLVVIGPFLCLDAWRIRKIFREPGEYIFCKTTLRQPHSSDMRGTFYFTVLLETEERGHFAADTAPIFMGHGWLGPHLEDYVNREVTVAYNLSTELVVVIG
jgi:hypothetical protein